MPPPDDGPELRLAGLGGRIVATLLDSLLLAAVFAALGMWIATRAGGLTESGFSLEGKPALLVMGATLLAGFLYYWLSEGLFGATPGKAIAAIRVARISGAPCGLGASLVRNLLRPIDAFALYLVGFIVALVSKSRQRVGDHAAGTIVVQRPTSALLRVLFVILLLLAVVSGGFGAYLIRGAGSAGVTVTESVPSQAPPVAATESVPSQAPPPSPPAAVTGIAPPHATPPVAAIGDLNIVDFRFLEGKGGPPRAAIPYRPGDKVCTTFDLAGFSTDGQGRADVSVEITSLDPDGIALFRPWQDRTHQTIARNTPANWTFNFDLPAFAPAGAYRVEIKARDAVRGVQASAYSGFTVEAPPFAPASEVEVRDFQLLASEGGPPLDPPVLAPGGALHMSARIAGLRFANNKPDAQVALLVTGPHGKTIVNEPRYLVINDEHLYHPPAFFVKATGWLQLAPKSPRGAYTLRFTVTDTLAMKSTVHEARFQVR